jgi:membrane-associated phospholipid phosphatase
MRSCILLMAGALALPKPLAAQAAPPRAVRPADIVSAVVATGIAVSPYLFGWGRDSVPCAPCNPADLPGFDRWAVHTPIPAWSTASHVGLAGFGTFVLVDLARRENGAAYAVAAVQAGLWAGGITEVLKAAVGRARPVLYTDSAAAATGNGDNLRSFPSGHTSVAFAFATTYWLARKDLTGSPGVVGWLGFVAAAGVGVMRVAAGRHFPSDVLGGAVLGTASGLIVHAVKF